MKRTSVGAVLVIACFIGMGIGSAAFADKGAFPGSNGQPFQALQAQISDLETFLDEELAQLWAAIAANNARDDDQDQRIALLEGALAALEARVSANEVSIEALEAKDQILEALIEALDARADALQAQIDANGGQIQDLILADQTLQALISALDLRVTTLEGLMAAVGGDLSDIQALIAALQNQISAAQAAIAGKQDRIWEYCGAGSSIRRVYADGSVVCEVDTTATGGFTSFTVETKSAYKDAGEEFIWDWATATAYCPSGTVRTGGGFHSATDVHPVARNYPYGNGWRVQIGGTWPVPYDLYSYAVCLKLQ